MFQSFVLAGGLLGTATACMESGPAPGEATDESAIYGGTAVNNASYPWVVHVAGSLSCQGVLIDARWVLTAAHCVNGTFGGVTVSYTRTNPTTGAVTGQSLATGTSSTYPHPQWDPNHPTSGYDIGLIHLPTAFTANPLLSRAELPLSSPAVGQAVAMPSNSALAGKFQVLSGAVAAGSTCLAYANELCVTSPTASACPGDSGSGVISVAGGTSFVTGIAANEANTSCNAVNQPFTATDVRPYLGWIRSHTGVTGGGYRVAPADYDGDGKTDLAVKFDSGDWRIDLASNQFGTWDWTFPGWGDHDSVPAPADYDGDGKADLAIKNSAGQWKIRYSSLGLAGAPNKTLTGYGDATAIPVPADYDGDGKADPAIKNSLGEWNINYSNTNGIDDGFNVFLTGYGNATAIPVPGDYDGDGKADPSVKNSLGEWNINYSGDGITDSFDIWLTARGYADALPTPGDYDGDGRTDVSVKDGSGTWWVDKSSDGWGSWNYGRSGYGSSGTMVPADYEGDHKTDYAIVGNDNNWYIDYSSSPADGWNAIIPIAY